MDVAPPTPPQNITAAAPDLDAVHQVRELRRELGAFARAAATDRRVAADQNAAVHLRIDEIERTLGAKLDRLLKHWGLPLG